MAPRAALLAAALSQCPAPGAAEGGRSGPQKPLHGPLPWQGAAAREQRESCYGTHGVWCPTAPAGCCKAPDGEVAYCCYDTVNGPQKCCFIDAYSVNITCCSMEQVCGAVCSQRNPTCRAGPTATATLPAAAASFATTPPLQPPADATAAPEEEEWCNFDAGRRCCGLRCCAECCTGPGSSELGCRRDGEVCCSASSKDPYLATAICPAETPQCCAPAKPQGSEHACCAAGVQCCAAGGCPADKVCCPTGCGCCHASTEQCRPDGTCERLSRGYGTPILLGSWAFSVLFSLFLLLGRLVLPVLQTQESHAGQGGNTGLCDAPFGGCGHQRHCTGVCSNQLENLSAVCVTCANYCQRDTCHSRAQRCGRIYTFEERQVRRDRDGAQQTVQWVVTTSTCPCTACACSTCLPTFYCTPPCENCHCYDCRFAELRVPWGAVLPMANGAVLFAITLVIYLNELDTGKIPVALNFISAGWAAVWGGVTLWSMRRAVIVPCLDVLSDCCQCDWLRARFAAPWRNFTASSFGDPAFRHAQPAPRSDRSDSVLGS